jgi:eukaryotic-like serine/threonine-protein kinase
MSDEPDDPLIGQVLSGRFEIVEPIGIGGMGRVYKAIQRPLDRTVALKVLNPRYDGSKDPGFEKRFFFEASMTARLKHPNTITVHDYGRTDEGVYYIAMEYVEGETLQQLGQREGPLAWDRVLNLGAQIARAVREAHQLGLVHRDLKPANIMLLPDGGGGEVVKVLDFGLVKSFLVERPRLAAPAAPEITQAGVLLGSPLYMAPEQAKNEVDPRTDIYSLGVLLFQAIAGRTPFQGRDSIEIIVKHIRERPPRLAELAEVPAEVDALVMKCLEKAPAARFQSMDQLLEAMRVATGGQATSGAFVDPRSSASGAERRAAVPVTATQPTARGPRLEAGERPAPVELAATGPHRHARTGVALGAVLVTVGGTAGALAAYQAFHRPPARAAVQPAPLAPALEPIPAAPREVLFEVASEPSGATVRRGGAVVGVTPFVLAVPRAGSDPARVELAFSLDGYLDARLVAQGLEGRVPVRQALAPRRAADAPPRAAPRPRRQTRGPDTPAGYKDDPYQ